MRLLNCAERNASAYPFRPFVFHPSSALADGSLSGLLRALYEHAKHYGTIPNAAPLDSANFQGQKSQKSARLSNLLSHVLLSHACSFSTK